MINFIRLTKHEKKHTLKSNFNREKGKGMALIKQEREKKIMKIIKKNTGN